MLLRTRISVVLPVNRASPATCGHRLAYGSRPRPKDLRACKSIDAYRRRRFFIIIIIDF